MKDDDRRFERELDFIGELLAEGRKWHCHTFFRTIRGSSVWKKWFDTEAEEWFRGNPRHSLIIECTWVDEKTGKRRYPNLLILSRRKFLTYPDGKIHIGEDSHAVCFDDLPTVSERVERRLNVY